MSKDTVCAIRLNDLRLIATKLLVDKLEAYNVIVEKEHEGDEVTKYDMVTYNNAKVRYLCANNRYLIYKDGLKKFFKDN